MFHSENYKFCIFSIKNFVLDGNQLILTVNVESKQLTFATSRPSNIRLQRSVEKTESTYDV